MRRAHMTKIVATLGPASSDIETIEKLFCAGADVFRLNFSHGNHDNLRKVIKSIRKIEKKYARPIGILGDLQGPKLRIGIFKDGFVTLKPDEPFNFHLELLEGGESHVSLPHKEIFDTAMPNQILLVDDGRIRFKIINITEDKLETICVTGGILSNRKGVNVPDSDLDISAITPKDIEDLNFGLEEGIDWVALSFVQRAEDVIQLRDMVGDRASIIAKFEKPQAIENMDSILEHVDAVMVARGDLGVELPAEEVPILQKKIINQCREFSKPVIVATQMLESMVASPTPTRAEASDVATAVFDGADAVMLSAESASGKYPVEAVEMMNRIVIRVEADSGYRKVMDNIHPTIECNDGDVISNAAVGVARERGCRAIVTYTTTGSTSIRVSRLRPRVPIISLTPSQDVARRLNLVWGVHTRLVDITYSFAIIAAEAASIAYKDEFGGIGESIVLTAGVPFGRSGTTNILRLVRIEDNQSEDSSGR